MYPFHMDQENLTCSWRNLRICHTVADHQRALVELLQNEYPNRRFVPVANIDRQSYNHYLVSDQGEIFTLYRNRRLAICEDEDGYQRVRLYADRHTGSTGYVYTFLYVHRIIWSSFNNRIPQDRVIDHYNNVKYGNRLSNLRLATRSQNAIYALLHLYPIAHISIKLALCHITHHTVLLLIA